MGGIIDNFADVDGTIQNPTGEFLDGQPVMGAAFAVRVFPLGGEKAVQDSFGNVRSGRVFQCATCPNAPKPGGTLSVGGESYDIIGVKPYRTLQGDSWGWRLTVAGGA